MFSLTEETLQRGESYEEGAARGVREELGLEARNLRYLGKVLVEDWRYPDRFFLSIFVCKGVGKIKLQKSEVAQVKLLKPAEVARLLENRHNVSPGLLKAFPAYLRGKPKRGFMQPKGHRPTPLKKRTAIRARRVSGK